MFSSTPPSASANYGNLPRLPPLPPLPPHQYWGGPLSQPGWRSEGTRSSQDSVPAACSPPVAATRLPLDTQSLSPAGVGVEREKRRGKGKEKVQPAKRWTMAERELLLEWFSQDPLNLERYKTKPTDTCEKIARDVFNSARSAHAIDAQWDAMKNKHKEARARLQGTGEGERDLQELRDDEDEWEEIQVGWLRKFCPYFEAIDEILTRDRSYLAPYASEAGGEEDLMFRSGQRVRIPEDIEPITDPHLENDPDEHPPAGGSKAPSVGGRTAAGRAANLKRGIATGSDPERKAVKKVKVDDLVAHQEARMEFDKEKFNYEKERDGRWMKFVEKKEDNRHKEAAQRMRLLQLKMMKDMGISDASGIFGDVD